MELWKTVYEPKSITPTVRQLFYALAVEELVPKNEKGYDKVQRTLARARERNEYPWEGIYDGLRQVKRPNTWRNLPDYFQAVRWSYRRDKWQDQPEQVEVWIEKDAVRGTVEAVTDGLEVPLLCGRGYLSVTAKKEASLRIGDKPLVVLYVGDFDPSGVNMIEETAEWIESDSGSALEVERVAITEEDHANPQVSHLSVNMKDVRAAGFVERYGLEVVEVEALAPEELQERVRNAILRHRDEKAWKKSLRQEKKDIEELAERLEDSA